jgi:hypothetical protein
MNTPKQIDPENVYWELDRAGALWQFSTARYTVALFAEEGGLDPADLFCDPRDVAFAREDEPAHWFMAVVAVYGPDGRRIGIDTLGACSYRSFREFYSAHRWRYSGKWITDPRSRAWKACNAKRRGHNETDFTGMVRQAISDARVTLAENRDGDACLA